jgi:hypothetical protein
MKVPPPKSLIVCAKPPQTIVRQCVLAAVSYVSALCGAASAQSVPAAPPLSISPAVQLSYPTEKENTYTVVHSEDLLSWAAAALPLYGNGADASQLFKPASSSGNEFFRVHVDTRPETGLAPWRMDDTMLLFNNFAGSARSFIFNAHGGGVVQRGASTEAFTWEWVRTGPDTGTCGLVYKSGETEMLDLSYLAGGTGGFSSLRTKAGFSTGAFKGTFRSVTDVSLTTFMPAQLGRSLITLAGTGRTQGIEVHGNGTASVASPAGVRTTPCTYSLKTAVSAELKLNGTAPDSESCVLTFTGPSCGTYVSTAMKNNILRRVSTGSFTITPN